MGLLCGCPVGAEIPSIPLEDCIESVGQIQKMVFQRIYSASGVKNTIVEATASITALATWTALLAATDGTKVVQSPFLSQPEFEVGAARKYGGGNATIGGIEVVVGREPTQVTGMFLNVNQTTVKALKELMCENVGVYFIDEFGRIVADSDGADPVVNYYPIPINGLFIGDKKVGGLEEPDSNTIEFGLYPNWSDNLRITTPADFDALTALVTP